MVYLCMHRASFLSETDHYILISVYETAVYIVSLGEHYIPISACTLADGGEGRYQGVYSLTPSNNVNFVSNQSRILDSLLF